MDYLVGNAITFCLDHLENVINRWAWHYHILNPFHQTFVTGYENRPNGPCIYVCNHQVPNILTCHQPCNTAQIFVSAEHHRHFSDVRIEGEPATRPSSRIASNRHHGCRQTKKRGSASHAPRIFLVRISLPAAFVPAIDIPSPASRPPIPHPAPRIPSSLPPPCVGKARPPCCTLPALASLLSTQARPSQPRPALPPAIPDPIRPEPARTNPPRPGPAGRRTSSGCPRTPTSASPSSGGTCPSTTTSPSSAATSAVYNVIQIHNRYCISTILHIIDLI